MREWWALLCQIGLWGWVFCIVGFILQSFGERNAFNGRAAVRWGGGTLLLIVVWIVGMSYA